MKTVAIINQKGGSGKTTLTLHLAVAAEQAGQSAVIFDIDPQASSMAWKDSRADETPVVTTVPFSRLGATLQAAAAGEADLALLDSAPHSDQIAMAAARAADLILIPFRTSVLDIRATKDSVELARLANKPAFGVINGVTPGAINLIADAAEAVGHYGLPVAPHVLHQRAAFVHSLTDGRVAMEYEPEGKAAKEIDGLYQWLVRQLKT